MDGLSDVSVVCMPAGRPSPVSRKNISRASEISKRVSSGRTDTRVLPSDPKEAQHLEQLERRNTVMYPVPVALPNASTVLCSVYGIRCLVGVCIFLYRRCRHFSRPVLLSSGVSLLFRLQNA